MEPSMITKITNYLQTDFKDSNGIWLTNSLTLRKTIGILGILLPILLYLILLIDSSYGKPLESISHYYYTRASGVFVSILSILALFLIIYRGKAPIDLIISTIAGITALFVAFFPTGNLSEICCDLTKPYSVTLLPASKFREIFHFSSAGIFFGCLAYMSVFLFTKSNVSVKNRGVNKKIRNRIYRTCGFIMIFAILIIFTNALFGWIPEIFYREAHLTFWLETVAIESFGISWLIKGEALLKD